MCISQYASAILHLFLCSLDNSTASQSSVQEILTRIQQANLVIFIVIFIVGILGNGLVIYVTGFRMKRTVNSVWFLNLALADFIFLTFLTFSIISHQANYVWQFGPFMCKLNILVGVVNMFASIFLLTAISVDRCLAIWVVVWAQNKRTVRKAQLVSGAIWVTALVCSTPYAVFREVREVNGKNYCVHSESMQYEQKLALTIFRLVVGFIIPFLVILACYVAIVVRVGHLQRTRRHRSRRIIFSVIFAFFICWLPFHLHQLLDIGTMGNTDNLELVKRLGGPLAMALAYTNSSLNPILYVFMCDEFQKKLKQSVCFVLESALAEDHFSFASSRSFSFQFSRATRRSDSSGPGEKNTTVSLSNSD